MCFSTYKLFLCQIGHIFKGVKMPWNKDYDKVGTGAEGQEQTKGGWRIQCQCGGQLVITVSVEEKTWYFVYCNVVAWALRVGWYYLLWSRM